MTVYAVALSGGVDSSTVAAILLNKGHEVFGVTMLTQASSRNIVEKASKIAKQLGIKHYIFDIIDEFKKEVIDYFINSYLNGTTPNPCAICNKKIKLNKLLMFAKEKGADYLATGHYASIDYINNNLYLKESKNLLKDQSYFLSLTDKEHLEYIQTPLSNIKNKEETRELARKFGLESYKEKDSQDICFIKDNNYKLFIENNIENKQLLNKNGNIILQSNGQIISKHRGLINYTIGQRRGLGIARTEPLYVTNINYINNTLTVGTKRDLIVKNFKVNQLNWLINIENSNFECFVKVRSGHSKFKALINKTDNNCITVNLLETNTVAICPGQVCALYNNENIVIGAGIIIQTVNDIWFNINNKGNCLRLIVSTILPYKKFNVNLVIKDNENDSNDTVWGFVSDSEYKKKQFLKENTRNIKPLEEKMEENSKILVQVYAHQNQIEKNNKR